MAWRVAILTLSNYTFFLSSDACLSAGHDISGEHRFSKFEKTLVFPVPTRERVLEHLGCHVWRWPCVRLKEYDRSGVLLVARCISGRSVREVRNIWCPVVQLWNQQGVFHYICHHSVRSLDCKNGFVNRSDWPQNIARRIGLSHYTIWIAYHWEI